MQNFNRYQELQAYVGWTPEDALRVQSIGPSLVPQFDNLIDDFYEEIERHPNAKKVITGGTEQTNRLKRTLHEWLHQLFSGVYDRDYVERRWRVGHRHVDIGLNQVYTNMALSRLRRGLLRTLEVVWQGSTEELLACRISLNTLIDLDLAIIEDAYQSEYQRRQATAERLAAIGKIAGGIAHELRNPLNVIKTSTYFLLNARNAPEEKRKTHLERIERQVGIADGVITALNDFSRLPIPHLEPVIVERCLRDAVEMNPLPDIIQVEWDIAEDKLVVLADHSQLVIVFGNLIRNARDAMPDGGTLRFRAAHGGQYDYNRRTGFRKGDLGRGSPRVLEPLYSKKAKGIGLGLSISHDIITRHHGSLTITSEPNAGAIFMIQLPAAPE